MQNARMTARQFLTDVVHPNVSDFHSRYDDVRFAYNAISAVDALAAHLFEWVAANNPSAVTGIPDDTVYRGALAARDQGFALLRDIAKAQKHVRLTRGSPQVSQASQITARPIGFGLGGFGQGRYGGPPQVVVDITPTHFEYVESVVDNALAFLEAEMTALGA